MNYDSPGKQKARSLVTEVFASEGGTVLDFYGGGRSAAAFVQAGLTVTSAEKERSLQERLEWDAAIYGYEAFCGTASQLKRTFDHAFTDFCGNASSENRTELQKIAPRIRKWLAVTLSSDHQINDTLNGPSAMATVPVWLVEATGMQLEYVGRYVRNERGQTMWIALLTPRDSAMHGNQMLAPLTIARDLRHRSYWATPDFRKRFPLLVAHRSQSLTERRKRLEQERYQANQEQRRAEARQWYDDHREEIIEREQQRRESGYHRDYYDANREKMREYHREYRRKNPEKIAEIRARYRRKKAA